MRAEIVTREYQISASWVYKIEREVKIGGKKKKTEILERSREWKSDISMSI